MELVFERKQLRCLRPVLCEIRDLELTQEVRLGEEQPDIGSILSCWGQPVLRTKDVGGGELSVSGGIMCWTLYLAEGENIPRVSQCWIPFQMKWNLQDGQGSADVHLRLRQMDARSASARKILIRAGIAGLAQVFTTENLEIPTPTERTEGVELLIRDYPIRVAKETGDKLFSLEEALDVSAEKLCGAFLTPEIHDCKSAGDKIAFQGNARLELFTLDEDGLHEKSYSIPFSQFAELDGQYENPDCQVQLSLMGLELDNGENGSLIMKCSICARYLVFGSELLHLAEDGYALNNDYTGMEETLELPGVLDTKRVEVVSGQTIDTSVGEAEFIRIFADFPRQSAHGTWTQRYFASTVSRNSGGTYSMVNSRWEQPFSWQTEDNTPVWLCPESINVTRRINPGGISVDTEESIRMTAWNGGTIPVLEGMRLGDKKEERDRPSVVIRCVGSDSLWEIAKSWCTTVEQIRSINHLEGEPEKGKLLLIPIP